MHQLNRDFSYAQTGRTDNQIRTWNDLAMFSPALDDASISMLAKSPALGSVTAPLQDRARSWLDSNCAYCHQPGGANAGFDARFTTPFANQGWVWAGVRDDLGSPGTVVIHPGAPALSAAWQRSAAVGPIAMPPLAKALAEEPAVDLLGAWIERLDPDLPRAGLRFEYYELTAPVALPDFDSLTPDASGVASGFDISVRQRDDEFAFRYRGYLQVVAPGDYTFYTSSDDGSRLLVDQALVVDNDGLHALQEASGAVTLSEGFHEIEVTMFEAGGNQALFVSWEGPATGGAKVPIGTGVLYPEVPIPAGNEPPVLDSPGDRVSRQGDAVVLQLNATDNDGDALYFDAAGLPEGLAVDHDTGEISGTPSASGATAVSASASDGPDVSVVTFTWTVTAPSVPDGGVPDGGPSDAGLPDAGLPDAGLPDAGLPDAGLPDAGLPDAGLPDGGTGGADGGIVGDGGGGCTVRQSGRPVDASLAWLLLTLALVWVRRTKPGFDR